MSNAGEAEIFIQTSDFVQQGILKLLFEGREDLIRSIIDSIQQVSQIPTGEHSTILSACLANRETSTVRLFS